MKDGPCCDILVSMTGSEIVLSRQAEEGPPNTRPATGRWRLQDAKARFSELVRRVRSEGPQHVTVHGRDEVVVIAAEEFRRLKGDLTGEALIAAMQASPHREIDIEPKRAPCPCARLPCDGLAARHERPVGAATSQAGTQGRRLRRRAAARPALRQRGDASRRSGSASNSSPTPAAGRSSMSGSRTRCGRCSKRVLPITEDVMLKWRLLVEEGRKAGHTFSQPDLIIAATALHHGLTVVTRDVSDYQKARAPALNPWLDAEPRSAP